MLRAVLASFALALLAVPVASQAGRSSPNDGCLVVSEGGGLVSISGRGVVFGRFLQGQMWVTDPLAGDGQAKVFGAEERRVVTETRTYYGGTDVRFRISGRFFIRVQPIFLDLSFVGRGTATLSADRFSAAGTFSVDSDSFCEEGFRPMPDLPRKFTIGAAAPG